MVNSLANQASCGKLGWFVATPFGKNILLPFGKRNRNEGRRWGSGGGNWGLWSRPRMASADGWIFTHEFREDSRPAWFLVLALPLHRDAFLERDLGLGG